MKKMRHKQSIADPCMYFPRNRNGALAIWLSWVDNNLIVGPSQAVKDEGKNWQKRSKLKVLASLNKLKGARSKFTVGAISKVYSSCHDSVSFGRIWWRKKKQVTLAEPNTVLKRLESGKIFVNKD